MLKKIKGLVVFLVFCVFLRAGNATQPNMPEDNLRQPIQVLSPVPGAVANGTVTSSSQAIAIPGTVTDNRITLISVDVDCYVRLGASNVTVSSATGTRLFAGTWVIKTARNTHLAVVRRNSDGTINLSDMG